jgi:hypothetical protein
MFITKENKPRVMILMGRNSIFKIGLIRPYKTVNTRLAIIKADQLAMEIKGKNQERIKSVIAVRKNGLSMTLFKHVF